MSIIRCRGVPSFLPPVLLSSALVLAPWAAAQEESGKDLPGMSKQLPGIPAGGLSPSRTHTWIRVRGGVPVLDPGHPFHLAWKKLVSGNDPNARKLADLGEAFQAFATLHGLPLEKFRALLRSDLRLSLLRTQSGEDFLFHAGLGEDEGELRAGLEQVLQFFPSVPVKTRKPGEGDILWELPSPFPSIPLLYAALEKDALLLTGSRASMDLLLSLLAGGGTSLAFDEDFKLLLGKETRRTLHGALVEPWLQVFLRPGEAAKALLPSGTSDLNAWLRQLGNGQALGFESRFVGGTFQDRLLGSFPEGSGPLFHLLDARGLEPGFVAKLSRKPGRGFVARLNLEAMDRPEAFRALGTPVSALFEALSTALPDEPQEDDPVTMKGLRNFLGGSVGFLSGPEGTVRNLVFDLSDSFQARTFLDRKARPAGRDRDQSSLLHRYVWELGKTTWHFAITSDLLYVTRDGAELDRLLGPRAGAGEEGTAWLRVPRRGEAPVLLGRDVSAPWTRGKPASAKTRLGEWIEPSDFQAFKREGKVVLEQTCRTGSLPLAWLTGGRVLDRFIEEQIHGNHALALEACDSLRRAEQSFMELTKVDEDLDGRGEATTLAAVFDARLVGRSEEFLAVDSEVFERRGYRFRILLPEKNDQREESFLLLAWPAKPGISGKVCYALPADGRILVHPYLPDLDPGTGPVGKQLFLEGAYGTRFVSSWVAHERRGGGKADPVAETEPPASVRNLDLEAAVRLLDKAVKRKDLNAIRTFLEHPEEQIIARAAYFLGNYKDREGIPALAGLMKSDVGVQVRRNATRALSLIQDPKTQASLIEALRDPDGRVRLHAATGLIGRKTPGAFGALLSLIDNYPEDMDGDRTQALLAIRDLDQPGCLKDLVAVKEGGSRFQQALVYTFQELSPRLSPKEEMTVLFAALENPNKLLRVYSIQRIGEAEFQKAIPALEARLGEESHDVQILLENTLSVLRPRSPLPSLEKLGESLLAEGLAGWHRFRALPRKQQGLIGGGLLLLILLGLFLLRGRREQRLMAEQAAVMDLLAPSPEMEIHPEEAEDLPVTEVEEGEEGWEPPTDPEGWAPSDVPDGEMAGFIPDTDPGEGFAAPGEDQPW